MAEKTREETISDIFKQLTPANKRYFMTMLCVAETAESNVRNAAGSERKIAGIKRMPERNR